MLYLGCPLWANPHWRGSLYPQGTSSSDFLAHYAAVFNSVEGNTSFYADPDSAEWRKVIKIKSKGSAYQILVHLRLDEVELQKEEE